MLLILSRKKTLMVQNIGTFGPQISLLYSILKSTRERNWLQHYLEDSYIPSGPFGSTLGGVQVYVQTSSGWAKRH